MPCLHYNNVMFSRIIKRLKKSEINPKTRRKSEDIFEKVEALAAMDLLPTEILREILYFLDTKTLSIVCPQVCFRWHDLLSDNSFWLEICIKTGRVLPPKHLRQKFHERFDYKKIFVKNPFGQNLIHNPSGSEGHKYWKMKDGGDGGRIEKPPVGADHDFDSCFVSSYRKCCKTQYVDLEKEGCEGWILDEIRPKITITEYHASRYDCGARYKFCPLLRDKLTFGVITPIEPVICITEQWHGREWKQVKLEFSDYPRGVRFVVHASEGSDTQFWKGHYGSKMANASVVISFH